MMGGSFLGIRFTNSRAMRIACCIACLTIVCAAALSATPAYGVANYAYKATAKPAWQVPDIDDLPDNDWGNTVRYGHDLVSKTASLIGPEVADPSRRFAGNNLNCQNCHLEAATRQYGLPFQGVYADFPQYRAREGAIDSIEDRIQGCMTRSMNGGPLPLNGREMTAIVAYLKFMSSDSAASKAVPGRGAGTMPELPRAANPKHGAGVYANNCAACHGDHGQGVRAGQSGDAKGYIFPPLWGDDSYNDGAGMNRLIVAANFVHANMPNGTEWQHPALTAEDAWDVAAYINGQPRPHMAGLERDYPKRMEKPVDTPYGPYGDSFNGEQHKLGPFAPIRAAAKANNAGLNPAAD